MKQAPLFIYSDGSTYAASVCFYGGWAATRLSLPVRVWHMLDPHREHADLVDLSGNLKPGAQENLLQELVTLEESKNRLARLQGETILESALTMLRGAGLQDVSGEQQHGSLVEHVEENSQTPSMIVIGKRGQSHGQARSHLGSNMERVIRAASCPVLVCSRETRPVASFLLAYDGGESSKKALEYVLSRPLFKGLNAVMVRVGHATPEVEAEMKSAGERLKTEGFKVDTRIVSGDPAHVFSVLVETLQIDLLVMGAYGHSRIRQFLVGSTTTEMIRSCRIPVLMFR
ncbi:MAG: universal stress protein [Candidatus Methylacidiphilales bacterium]